FANLPLDADDDAFHRPSRYRHRIVFRHPPARLVADFGSLGTGRLCQRAGVHLELDRAVDRICLYLGSTASPAQRHPPFRVGPWLRLQGQRAGSLGLGRADRRHFTYGPGVDSGLHDRRRTMSAHDSEHAPSMRTPLGKVRNLGASHSGTRDFWYQRLTAVAMALLIIPVIVIVMMLLGRNQAGAAQILGSLPIAVILLLFIVASTWHMKIGMQEVIEDYVHTEKLKLAAIMANNFLCFGVALASIYAILKLSSGV